VAFENLGPPRLSKLLFEAFLLAEAATTMSAVRAASAAELSERTLAVVRDQPRRRSEIVSIGIPILLPDGRLLRGPECKIPAVAAPTETHAVTAAALESWANAGWVDLRESNMARWKARFDRIEAEVLAISPADSSSRFLRDRQFWGEDGILQPGKTVGWIFATEEKGARIK
jgi:hypothetical protein